VIADNFKGAYNATTSFINSGYKRIAAISNPPVLSITSERLAGYKAALNDHNISFR
jgi:LacI family transcriptional regulator